MLAEMWLKLSEKEKQVWRQKVIKMKRKGTKGMISTGTKSSWKPGVAKIRKEKEPRSSISESVLTQFEDMKPIDIAAHFCLLGENLIKIGQKYEERNVRKPYRFVYISKISE